MMLSSRQLQALATVCDEGSFDQAAATLAITPSALSQRIAGLERAVGQALVRRSRPATPTRTGETVLRLARQTILIQAECLEALAEETGGGRVRTAVAVNADSLSTWFREVVADVAAEDRLLLEIAVEDESRTAHLLRAGEVMAAVTTDPHAAQGSTSTPLGSMRYLPVASPDLLERAGIRRPRVADLSRMPMLRFGPHDDLQHALLADLGVAEAPPVHLVPSNADFRYGVLVGLGWGVVPQQQVREDLRRGSLVGLPGRAHVDVPLHWQRWGVESAALDRLSALVSAAARVHLQPPG